MTLAVQERDERFDRDRHTFVLQFLAATQHQLEHGPSNGGSALSRLAEPQAFQSILANTLAAKSPCHGLGRWITVREGVSSLHALQLPWCAAVQLPSSET